MSELGIIFAIILHSVAMTESDNQAEKNVVCLLLAIAAIFFGVVGMVVP